MKDSERRLDAQLGDLFLVGQLTEKPDTRGCLLLRGHLQLSRYSPTEEPELLVMDINARTSGILHLWFAKPNPGT